MIRKYQISEQISAATMMMKMTTVAASLEAVSGLAFCVVTMRTILPVTEVPCMTIPETRRNRKELKSSKRRIVPEDL